MLANHVLVVAGIRAIAEHEHTAPDPHKFDCVLLAAPHPYDGFLGAHALHAQTPLLRVVVPSARGNARARARDQALDVERRRRPFVVLRARRAVESSVNTAHAISDYVTPNQTDQTHRPDDAF